MSRLVPNSHLIGAPEGRQRLDTPALLFEEAVLDRNIQKMAALAARHGVNLRPHAKAHKSVEIARRQIAAGAIGLSCATLGEAEVFVAHGIRGVLITSPIVSPGKIRRLIELARRSGPDGLLVVVDHPDVADEVANSAQTLDFRLSVLVDYAAGYSRTGAPDPQSLLALAQHVAAQAQLRLAGLQAYAGHIQHIVDPAVRRQRAAVVREQVAACIELLRANGIPPDIVTGVGTGTHDIDSTQGIYTEIQPGSYVFMDAEYRDVLPLASGSSFELSLFLRTTVVSTSAAGWVTTDAGSKSLMGETPARVARGRWEDCTYAIFGDEHGKLSCSGPHPQIGDHLELIVPHCDPTVNLHNFIHVVDGDRLVAVWPIEARGLF